MTPRSLTTFLTATLLLLCAACNSRPAATTVSAPPTTQSSQARSDFPKTSEPRDTLPFLASDELAGRAPGTPGLVRAGDFLAAELSRIGLQPAPGMSDYFQSFSMPLTTSLGAGTG